MVPPSSFFLSFGIPICFHILFFKILFSEFFVVLFRCFFVSFIFRFSTTNRCLSMAQCTQYKKKDTLRKARPSPRVEKVTFSSTLREGQVVATRCSMSVTFPLLRLQPTTPGTLWIVGISGDSRPPVWKSLQNASQSCSTPTQSTHGHQRQRPLLHTVPRVAVSESQQ